jgi:hypothetical protein
MKKFGLVRYLVAIIAKTGNCFFAYQRFTVAAVRIMALYTVLRLERLMHILFCRLLQMAILTEVLLLPRKLPGMLLDLQRLVARVTFTKTDRSVYVSLFVVIRMTLFCNTRFL